jgi:dihydroorotate dehydrogenase electron transfer subunit
MVWLPVVGEFPMSVSRIFKGGLVSISVKAMGKGSKILYDSKAGDVIAVRGPYGNSFNLSRRRKRVLLIGGGTGMVPMIVLAKELRGRKLVKEIEMVIAARSKEELPFLTYCRELLGHESVFPSTDDGSLGFKGLAHELVRRLLSENKFDEIFACGPEAMMKGVYDIARSKKVLVEMSLERIMKCGIGICGSCAIVDTVLCKDGPVFDSADLDRVRNEFGAMYRDKSGKLVAN